MSDLNVEDVSKRITIRDVAKASKVSSCTASYALRGSPRVAKKTQEHVKAIAKEMSYRVSSPVSNWMSQLRSNDEEVRYEVILFLLEASVHEASGKVLHLLFEGAKERALEHGYRLELFTYNAKEFSDKRLSDILKARGIRGVVVGPLPRSKSRLDLDWDSFAAAGFDSYWWRPAVHRSGNDYYSAVLKGMDFAEERGYKRIGLVVVGEQDTRYSRQLTAAYASRFASLDDRSYMVPYIYDAKNIDYDGFARWVDEKKPDCIIGSQLVPNLLDALGLRCPSDIGYICTNVSMSDREVAGFFHDFKLMGASTVDHVISQLNRNVLGLPEIPIMTLVRPVWVEGPTIVAPQRP